METETETLFIDELKPKLCAFCGEHEAEIPITDGETLQQVWICEYCDSDLFDNSIESKGLKPKEVAK